MAVQCPQAYVRPGPARHHVAVEALTDAFDALRGIFRVWVRRIRERQQLANLDDRTIRDIGLTRAEAMYLSDKPFWRE